MGMDEATFSMFGYRLDESDPGILVLRRQDGSFVAGSAPWEPGARIS